MNQDAINVIVRPLKYISIHRHSFQAFIVNDFDGLELECIFPCNPLPYLHIENDLYWNIVYMAIEMVCLWVLGILALYASVGKFKRRRKAIKQEIEEETAEEIVKRY